MNKLFLFGVVLCSILSINTIAQNKQANLLVTGNAGGTMQSNSYTIDFTVGEVMTEAFQGATVMLTQGFHQADLESATTDQGVASGIEDTQEFQEEELSVYPNPFKKTLNISYSFERELQMDVSVTDITGKVVMTYSDDYNTGTQQLDLSLYPKGIYFIKFYNQENQKLRTFKIIKS